MTTHVLVTASLDLKGGRPDRIDHYHGTWYAEENPGQPLETMTGTLDEVTAWAESKGTDIDFQLPSAKVLDENRRSVADEVEKTDL